MYGNLFTLLLVALAAVLVNCQKIETGGCPDVQVKENLDISKYAGVWYEIEKNPVPFEAGLKCNQANYTAVEDYISVVNTGVSKRSGRVSSIEGKATIPDKNVTAKLKVKFSSMPFSADYWVVDTDYNKYSVVYSCFSILKLFNAEYLWILSRTPSLDDATKQKVYQLLDNNKINRKNLAPTEQDC